MNSSRRPAADKIQMSAIGAVMRFEKIESARSAATTVREQRQQEQETVEGKLLANEMGLTELRKMVDDWEGEDIPLHQLEAVVLMKEKECKKARKLVAEASTRNTWGSTSVEP
jgi:choline kinase